MKKLKCLTAVALGLCLIICSIFPVWGLSPQPEPPDIQSITLSKGTKVEKIGPGHFRFKLPDAKAVEVKGLTHSKERGVAVFKECSLYDPIRKLIASGTRGKLKGSATPSGQSKVAILGDPGNFVKIDDDVIWFPATITCEVVKMTRKP